MTPKMSTIKRKIVRSEEKQLLSRTALKHQFYRLRSSMSFQLSIVTFILRFETASVLTALTTHSGRNKHPTHHLQRRANYAPQSWLINVWLEEVDGWPLFGSTSTFWTQVVMWTVIVGQTHSHDSGVTLEGRTDSYSYPEDMPLCKTGRCLNVSRSDFFNWRRFHQSGILHR